MKRAKKRRHAWKYVSQFSPPTKRYPAVCERCGWLLWTERSKHTSGFATLVSAPGGKPMPYSQILGCSGKAQR